MSAITIEDLRYRYTAGDPWALAGASLTVEPGEIVLLQGESGSGKSTLLRSVNRMNDLIDSVRIEGEMRLNGDPIYAPGQDVIELRTAGKLLLSIAALLMVYVIVRAENLAAGVAERRIELNELRLRVELLERQMAADPSMTGGVSP